MKVEIFLSFAAIFQLYMRPPWDVILITLAPDLHAPLILSYSRGCLTTRKKNVKFRLEKLSYSVRIAYRNFTWCAKWDKSCYALQYFMNF